MMETSTIHFFYLYINVCWVVKIQLKQLLYTIIINSSYSIEVSYQKKKNNFVSENRPEWLKCLFVRHPWPYPHVVALDVVLLHPLQGVDTIFVTGQFTGEPVTCFICIRSYHTFVLVSYHTLQLYDPKI